MSAEEATSLRTRALIAALGSITLLAGVVTLLYPRLVNAGINDWTPISLPVNMNITALALSPAFPCDHTVFAGTDCFGVYRTTEGHIEDGVWNPVNNGLGDASIIALAISPNYNRCDRASQFGQGDSTVVAGTRTGGVFISSNGGATWTASNSGLPSSTAPLDFAIAAIGISPNYASDRTIFVSVQATSAGGPNAVYRSTDGGSTWFPFDAGLSDRSVQAFALSANFANDATLFLGTRFSGIFRFAGTLSQPSSAGGPTPTPTATVPASPPPGGSPSPVPAPAATPAAGTSSRRLSADISFPYPSMRVVVTAQGTLDGQIAYTVPGPVVLNYEVINNGNEPLTEIAVGDGGKNDFCGDDPSTPDVNEAIDDNIVGTIARIEPGQSQILTSTVLVRPESASSGAASFLPKRLVGCAIGKSASAGRVGAQDDVIIQLVVWQSITPSNSELTDLWIWSFAVSPFFANDQTIYAGSAYGGLFKSNNAGTAAPTWKRVNSGLEPEWIAVRSIVMSPRYPVDHTIYVGTDGGIFAGVEQPDGNVRWSALNQGLQRRDVRALAISPNYQQDHVVYAAAWGNDLYRLRNGTDDATWVPQRRFLNGLWAWAVALTQDNVLLGGTWSAGPFWQGIIGRNVLSGSGGWEFPSLPTLPGGETTAFAVSPTYCTGYEIFAATWDRGLLKSVDAGRTWAAVPLPSGQPIRSVSLSPNYAADRTVYVATWGTGIYRSFDGGATWGQLNAGLSDQLVRTVLLPPTYPQDGIVFAGTDGGGVFRWDPGQQRWSQTNAGLPNNRVMALTASPRYAFDGTLAAATWGGGVAFSYDRGASWIASTGGITSPYVRAVAFSPNYATTRAVYAGTTNGAARSLNGGASWDRLGAPGNDLDGVDITGFAITAGSPTTIFVSTGGKGFWAYTEGGSLAGAVPGFRLSQAPGGVLPFHSYIPGTPKGRPGAIC